MSMTFCFWALLSLENFEFIYLPSFIKNTEISTGNTVGKVLLSHSLLEFIHPEELSLATTDLLNFIRIKTLAGAITRCRLRCIKSFGSDNLKNEDWRVTDVVMYTATNRTILTFFHTHQTDNQQTNACSYNTPLDENEARLVSEALQKLFVPFKKEDPYRLFQIYNTKEKKKLLQWPHDMLHFSTKEACFHSIIQHATHISMEEIEKQSTETHRSGTDCTQHAHSNTAAFLEPCGVCQIEKIIIIYGSLTFSSFQVTPIDNQFYHQHLNRIPDKTTSNYEKFMKSFIGTSSPPPPIKNCSCKKTIEKPSSTKVTFPKAWKSRFGVIEKKCENCSTNKSPEWRKGPSGHKSLCNACGLRYARLVAKQEKKKKKSDDEEEQKPKVNKRTKKS